MFAVKIRFDRDADPQILSMGSGGTAAIYTNKGRPVHIISKVALRMKKVAPLCCPLSTEILDAISEIHPG
jgi:hypothetical protein